MKTHEVGAVIQRVHDTSTLPTPAFYHLHWQVQRDRMCSHWDEDTWTNEYFFRMCMGARKLNAAAVVEFGVPELITSHWHYGVGAGCVDGHGAFQQTPEQGHSNFKRLVPPASTLLGTLQNVEKAIGVWTGEPSDDEENGLTLLANPQNLDRHHAVFARQLDVGQWFGCKAARKASCFLTRHSSHMRSISGDTRSPLADSHPHS